MQDHSYTNNNRLSDAERELDSGQMCTSLVNDDEELDVPDVQNVWEDSFENSPIEEAVLSLKADSSAQWRHVHYSSIGHATCYLVAGLCNKCRPFTFWFQTSLFHFGLVHSTLFCFLRGTHAAVFRWSILLE